MGLDSQAFAAFGAACVDDGTTASGFHADQKAVGTRAACFRGLVSAFHGDLCLSVLRKPMIIPNFQALVRGFGCKF